MRCHPTEEAKAGNGAKTSGLALLSVLSVRGLPRWEARVKVVEDGEFRV